MKRTRHTPEQIIRKLREADADLANGVSVPDIGSRVARPHARPERAIPHAPIVPRPAAASRTSKTREERGKIFYVGLPIQKMRSVLSELIAGSDSES